MGRSTASSARLEALPSAPVMRRLAFFTLLFGVEVLAASVAWDGGTPVREGQWIAALIHRWAPWALRFAIAFGGILGAFAYLQIPSLKRLAIYEKLRGPVLESRVNLRFLAAHIVLFVLWTYFSAEVYGTGGGAISQNQAAVGWLVSGTGALTALLLAFMPAGWWMRLMRAAGYLSILSASAAGLAIAVTEFSQTLWKPAANLTFYLVRWMLSPFVSVVVFQPENFLIGTRRFKVIVSQECSGLEGVGLLLVFSALWMILFRREIRFPQAFAIVPVGVVLSFVLNAVRIAALVLIGGAGAKEIAAGGFHSQAGWILFTCVALGLCWLALRSPWIARVRKPAARSGAHADAVAAYLLPFIAILMATMLSRTVTGRFEWLYGLRLAAAGLALWKFRGVYKRLDWRFGWTGVGAGIAVFLLWIGLDWILGTPQTGMPAALVEAASLTRFLWIASHVATSVAAAPLAEELAFRGFAARRLVSADFESVSLRDLHWMALAGSSLLFGAMHGQRWIAATLAGLLYGWAARSTGRLGDSVAGHALTNALLALLVLGTGRWELW